MGTQSVAAGTSMEVEFPLDCYVSFQKPGVYTVTAGHDLGWKLDAKHPHPVALATLKVTLPTEAEARRYVDDVFARQPTTPPRDNSDELGRQMKLEKALSVLRHPIFLPALVQHAQAGSKAAVKGIGHIATQEATEALLNLLEHASAEVEETSALQLLRRLPARADSNKPADIWYWGSPYQIEPLLPASWDARFEQQIQKAALKLLSHQSENLVGIAAQTLQTRGTGEHAPQVLEVLQKSLDFPHELRAGLKTNTLDLPLPQKALLTALDGMRQRGWRLENGGGNMAHQVAWLRQLADKEVPKPQGDEWKSAMLTWVENGPPTLKVCALQALPQPLSDAAAKAVMHALEDPDWRVQRIACEVAGEVAGESKSGEFVRSLVKIIELEHESFLQGAAHRAALACGARLELWEAWTGVIPDKECTHEALRCLIFGTIQLPPSNGSGGSTNFTRKQGLAIRDAWRAFLQQHQKQLAAGEKVSLSDTVTAAKLTGAYSRPTDPPVVIYMKDGNEWPPRRKK